MGAPLILRSALWPKRQPQTASACQGGCPAHPRPSLGLPWRGTGSAGAVRVPRGAGRGCGGGAQCQRNARKRLGSGAEGASRANPREAALPARARAQLAEPRPREPGTGRSCPALRRLLPASKLSALVPCSPRATLGPWVSTGVRIGPWERGGSQHPGCTQPLHPHGLGLCFPCCPEVPSPTAP